MYRTNGWLEEVTHKMIMTTPELINFCGPALWDGQPAFRILVSMCLLLHCIIPTDQFASISPGTCKNGILFRQLWWSLPRMTVSHWQQSGCGRRWKARRVFCLVQFGWFEDTQLNKEQTNSQPSLQWVLPSRIPKIFSSDPSSGGRKGPIGQHHVPIWSYRSSLENVLQTWPRYQCPVHRFSQLGLR